MQDRRPGLLAIASAGLCTLVLLWLGPASETSPGLAHELRKSASTPEGAAQRFLLGCAAGQRPITAGLSRTDPPPCPRLPRTLRLQVVLESSEMLESQALRLRGKLALHAERRDIRIDLARDDAGWYVRDAALE